jgi:FkbM family methyltransferase
MLEENLGRNHLANVSALRVGAAAERGTEKLVSWDEKADNWGVSSFVSSERTAPVAPEYEIETSAIDDLLEKGPEVDLVKMDIEGAECVALRGMVQGLREKRYKRILLELHPAQLTSSGVRPSDVVGLVRNSGYRILKIDHSPRITRELAYSRYGNVTKFLSPFTESDTFDAWPHLLCLAPGLEL